MYVHHDGFRPCIPGHSIQVTLPVATVGGLPVGLSIIGPAGSDERLLVLTEGLAAALKL